jgi:lambda repressor-like predicted transcriptional regulator
MSRPRPPSYNPKTLQKRLSVMEVAKNRFNMLDEHRKKDELPTTYITLEGLSFFQASREQGYSDEELREAWCESWGKEEVIVPAALLNTLMTAWLSYRDAPAGTTLGESFGLEGGGQGKSKKHKLQMTRDHSRGIAQQVEIEHRIGGENGEPISVERAQTMVVEQRGLSIETVRKAHKKYKNEISQKLQ